MLSWRNLAGIPWPIDPEYVRDEEQEQANIKVGFVEGKVDDHDMIPEVIKTPEQNSEPPAKRSRWNLSSTDQAPAVGTDGVTNSTPITNPNESNPSGDATTSASTTSTSTATTATTTTSTGDASTTGAAPAAPRGRPRSRWGAKIDPVTGLPVAPTVPAAQPDAYQPMTANEALRVAIQRVQQLQMGGALANGTPTQLSAEHSQALFTLKMQISELSAKMMNPAAWLPSMHDRSPSPDPIYDTAGKRLNTREYRLKMKFQKERNMLIEQVQTLEPTFSIPGYKRELPSVRIPLPVDQHPTYNFHGLIIGPRGNTQKKLEKETGCKISVRGRPANGDIKAKCRAIEDDDDPYVFVQGETMDAVENAANIIRELIVPRDEETNFHKLRQLRELAELNGVQHQQKNLRQRIITQREQLSGKEGSFDNNSLACAVCGAAGHLTKDCPKKGSYSYSGSRGNGSGSGHGGSFVGASHVTEIDREYEEFMADIYKQKATPASGSGSGAGAELNDDSSDSASTFLPPPPSFGLMGMNMNAMNTNMNSTMGTGPDMGMDMGMNMNMNMSTSTSMGFSIPSSMVMGSSNLGTDSGSISSEQDPTESTATATGYPLVPPTSSNLTRLDAIVAAGAAAPPPPPPPPPPMSEYYDPSASSGLGIDGAAAGTETGGTMDPNVFGYGSYDPNGSASYDSYGGYGGGGGYSASFAYQQQQYNNQGYGGQYDPYQQQQLQLQAQSNLYHNNPYSQQYSTSDPYNQYAQMQMSGSMNHYNAIPGAVVGSLPPAYTPQPQFANVAHTNPTPGSTSATGTETSTGGNGNPSYF